MATLGTPISRTGAATLGPNHYGTLPDAEVQSLSALKIDATIVPADQAVPLTVKVNADVVAKIDGAPRRANYIGHDVRSTLLASGKVKPPAGKVLGQYGCKVAADGKSATLKLVWRDPRKPRTKS